MNTTLPPKQVAATRKTFALATLLILMLSPIHLTAITGGVRDGTAHANVGAVVINFQGGLFVLGSGTLIDDKMFLTAGHCVEFIQSLIDNEDIDASDVFVSFDPENALDIAGLIPVTQWSAHPDYPGKDNIRTAVDVGVLILQTAPAEAGDDGLRAD